MPVIKVGPQLGTGATSAAYVFTGDSGSGGRPGIVPAPAAGSAAANEFLSASGQFTPIPTLNQNTTGTAANVTGTVAIANGGTGQTTQQAAIDALAGAQSAGKYLRSDGTHATLSTIQAADVPTLNQNTTGTAANVTATVAIANGGTGQTSAPAALAALGGFANPMTTAGDLIVGGAAGAPGRVASGTSGNVLTSNGPGTAPTWQVANSGATTNGVFHAGVSIDNSSMVDTLAAPTVSCTIQGTPGTSHYTYYVYARQADGSTGPVGVVNTTTSALALNSTNYNQVNWTAVTGAVSYDVVRVLSPGSDNGRISIANTGLTYNDQGAHADVFSYTLRSSELPLNVNGNSYTTGNTYCNGTGIFGGGVISGFTLSTQYNGASNGSPFNIFRLSAGSDPTLSGLSFGVFITPSATGASRAVTLSGYDTASGTPRTIVIAGPVAIGSSPAPATSTSAGVVGQIAWDSGFFYVCIAANTWVRTALSSF